MKTKLIFSSLWILLFLFVISCNVKAPKINEKVVKVGVNLPLSGDLATYGISVQEGITLAKEEFSDTLKKYNIELLYDFQDNKGEAKTALSIFQKHKLEDVQIYMSGVTQQSMAIKDLVNQEKIPHFLWAFTPVRLTEGEFLFRNYVNFGVEAQFYVDFIKRFKPKKVALIYVNISGTDIQFNQIVKPQILDYGIKFIMQEPYDISKSDFKDLAAKVKAYDPDVIVMNGFKDNLIQLIKDFKAYKISEKSTVICSFDLLDAAAELSNELLEGFYVTSPIFNSRENPNTNNWKERFRTRFHKEPKYTNAYAYDNYTILLDVIKKCHAIANKDSLRLQILKTNLEGITGQLSFQNNGEMNLSLEICKYINGKLTPAE